MKNTKGILTALFSILVLSACSKDKGQQNQYYVNERTFTEYEYSMQKFAEEKASRPQIVRDTLHILGLTEADVPRLSALGALHYESVLVAQNNGAELTYIRVKRDEREPLTDQNYKQYYSNMKWIGETRQSFSKTEGFFYKGTCDQEEYYIKPQGNTIPLDSGGSVVLLPNGHPMAIELSKVPVQKEDCSKRQRPTFQDAKARAQEERSKQAAGSDVGTSNPNEAALIRSLVGKTINVRTQVGGSQARHYITFENEKTMKVYQFSMWGNAVNPLNYNETRTEYKLTATTEGFSLQASGAPTYDCEFTSTERLTISDLPRVNIAQNGNAIEITYGRGEQGSVLTSVREGQLQRMIALPKAELGCRL